MGSSKAHSKNGQQSNSAMIQQYLTNQNQQNVRQNSFPNASHLNKIIRGSTNGTNQSQNMKQGNQISSTHQQIQSNTSSMLQNNGQLNPLYVTDDQQSYSDMKNENKNRLSAQQNSIDFQDINGNQIVVPASNSNQQANMQNLKQPQSQVLNPGIVIQTSSNRFQNQYITMSKNKTKQSKTSSANSPVTTQNQLLQGSNATVNYNNIAQVQLAKGYKQYQQAPQTIQMKSSKMHQGYSKTTNQSPMASSSNLRDAEVIYHTNQSQNENLNLIHQLQKNQKSMLNRAHNQMNDIESNHNFNKNFTQQESSSDINHEQMNNGIQVNANGDYINTHGGNVGNATNSTIQHLPNMIVGNSHGSMSAKHKGDHNNGGKHMQQMPGGGGARSRMSLKQQPSNGTQGSQNAIKSTYNQKRMQTNSLQMSVPTQSQLHSQASQHNVPPIQHQQQIQKAGYISQTPGNRLGSQEFLRKKSANKSNQQNQKRNQQYMNQPTTNVQSGYMNQMYAPQNQVLNTQSSNANLQVYDGSPPQMVHQSSKVHQGGSLIQAPHFIKVKSKTNANPTRQNSPREQGVISSHGQRMDQQRYSGKYLVSNGKNPLRESNNSKNKKLQHDETPPMKGNINYSDNQLNDGQQPVYSQIRAQVFSMPNSPNKGEQHAQQQMQMQETNISIGQSQSIYSKNSKIKNLSVSNNNQVLRNSIDQKIQNIQQLKNNQIKNLKGGSSKDVYSNIVGTNGSNSQTSGRIQSGNHKNFQSNIRRLNSPNSPNAVTGSQNQVPYLNQNQVQYNTQMQPVQAQADQQKKYLNMAVSKNIGGIASGKTRRENRNQMMKNHQNQAIDNKSVVGSMGSMGSLGPFMGVQDGSSPVTDAPDGYNSMKLNVDRQHTNKTNNGSQPYSQLQQMHLNNLNPMFFATGEVLQQPKNALNRGNNLAPNMNSIHQQQMMTMGGPHSQGIGGISQISSPIHHNSSQQSKNSTVGGAQQTTQYRQKKNSSTTNGASYMGTSEHLATNQTYYDSNRQNVQQPGVKTSVIQMRKIGPISKTTAVGSKNPSIERGKTNIQTQQSQKSKNQTTTVINSQNSTNQSTQQRMMQSKQKQQFQYQIGMGQTTKNFSQTAKVTQYNTSNNSPINRSKVAQNGLPNAMRQQQVRQQQIGQPKGDIPLMKSNDGQNGLLIQQQELDYINAQSSNYNTNHHNDTNNQKKHHLAQSVLIGEQNKMQGGYQTNYQQNKHYSKSIIGPPQQSYTAPNQAGQPGGDQIQTPNIIQGKMKLKVMSQTNSPPHFTEQSKHPSSGQYSKMSKKDKLIDTSTRRGSAIHKSSSKGAIKTSLGTGRSNGRGAVTNGTTGSSKNDMNIDAASMMQPQAVPSKSSSKGGGNVQNEVGQQYFKQYFKQKKSSNFIQINDKYGAQGGNGYTMGKYAQIDSPKDSSIERARHVDMIQQERQISQMNRQLQNVISIENQQENFPTGTMNTQEGSNMALRGLNSQGSTFTQETQFDAMRGGFTASGGNQSMQYIINQLETKEVNKLSPRSKEVYLIKKLITDCFKKYSKPPKTQLELYKIGKTLGKGAFGKVNLGLHRLTRKLVAIKSINMDFMKEESQKKKIMNEINILKSLRHPNNIKILETFQTDKHHMIVMELCPGGDLLNYVRKRRKLNEKYARFVFKQIMEGIAYLHENKVAHRDIKLDNILLDGHGNIKIGDFGVSRKIEENEILFEQCGTPAYIAPEIVKDMGYKGFPVDIWSAGICLYAMLYGNVPFKANQIGDLNTVEQLNQDIEYKETVSKDAIVLMKKMLQKTPSKRATAHDVLEDEWLCKDEVSGEHIDIFDEQELELIRKEFTYVVQKKKLKDFEDAKQKLREIGGPDYQASRRPDDLNTEFTECSIQTHENSLMRNDSSRSVILCPFNTQTGDKNADKIIAASQGLMEDKDLMIRFHPRVRELDRNYEKLNNQDFDNGVYHKYAYKQKINKKEGEDDKDKGLKEEQIRQSDVQMNNLVAESKNTETARRRHREKADINYHNYYIKINDNIIQDTSRLGFPMAYIQKCLRENANNHCTTTYYLLCMDQNF